MAAIRYGASGALARAADSVLAKIAATLPDEQERQLLNAIAQVFRPEPRYGPNLDLVPLRSACWQEQAVDIRYVDGDGATSERTILPLALFYTEACVTVLSWYCVRKDFRMFRTDRMVELRPNGASFRPRRVPLLRDYLARLKERRGAHSAG